MSELVLIIGDAHIPLQASGLPSQFVELLNTDKIKTVLATGNLGQLSEKIQSLGQHVHVVKGSFDWKNSTLPEEITTSIGQWKIGLIGGHQLVPQDKGTMGSYARKLDCDILVVGSVRTPGIFQEDDGRFLITPGSVTLTPSFMLMAISGDTAVVYVYEVKDGELAVNMSEIKKP
jgi:vacuolar protein sorting-associated protein 29